MAKCQDQFINFAAESINKNTRIIEDAINNNTRLLEESMNSNTRLLEDTLSRNTDTLSNMHAAIEINTKTINEVIDMVKEKDEALKFLYEMLKQEIKLANDKRH